MVDIWKKGTKLGNTSCMQRLYTYYDGISDIENTYKYYTLYKSKCPDHVDDRIEKLCEEHVNRINNALTNDTVCLKL